MMHRHLRTLIAMGLALASVTCSGAEITVVRSPANPSSGGPAQPAFTVTLNTTAATLSVGATTTLAATVHDSTGALVAGAVVTWSSGNAAIASVTAAGLVTGIAPGTVSIGATYSGVTASASITVASVPVASVQVIPAADTLQVTTTAQLTAVPKDANGVVLTGRVISWSSNNPAAASVNASGLVTANAVGPATISAISEGQVGTAAITVVNNPVASVTVAPGTGTVYVGRTLALSATTRDAGNNILTGRIVTWTSANPSVATVSATGVVTGVAAGGPVTITATSEGQTGTAAITVTLVPVASVTVSPATAGVVVGATTTLTATLRDSGGNVLTGRTVTWTSANTGLATVSASGVVTGVTAGGPVTITATSGSASGTSNVTVTTAAATLVRVILAPDTVTLLTGGTKQFVPQGKMSDSSIQAVSVTFAAAGGAITQGGLYTAGSNTGTFSIIATAQGQALADTSRATIVAAPPPGSYTTAVYEDWLGYASTSVLQAANLFAANDTRFPVNPNIAIVPDATFGQVARIRQPLDTNTQVNSGWTLSTGRTMPYLLDKAWFRFRVRFSPGWTTIGNYPAGAANAYKLVFMLWESGYTGRAQIEWSNTNEYILGIGGVGCTETSIPGSALWPRANAEWNGGEWWEYIMYYEKTSPTSQRMRWWGRQLTSGGVIVNNPFYFFGLDRVSCVNAPPRVRGITLGGNKNRTTPADQYIFWGPFEVVDGLLYPNPYGVGP